MNRCGLPQPADGFLEEMSRMIRDAGALFIMDEIVTGFRYGLGGAQEYFGLQADLVAYGKCLGGGAPIGALAGSADSTSVLDMDREGRARVPHSGTFNATPLSLAAASAFLNTMRENPHLYEHVNQLGEEARRGINALGERLDIPLLGTGAHSMFQVHYGIRKLKSYRDFARRDIRFRQHLYWYMAVNGIYIPPSGTFFFSAAHTEADARQFLQCLEAFLEEHYLPLSAETN
jgi:glutamate-1-semialdehyde 2,1-aminomutase